MASKRAARTPKRRRPGPAEKTVKGDRSRERDDVVGVYQRITSIVWQRLSPTFGLRTINAIARNVIARRANDRELALLEVGSDGLLWDKLEAIAHPPSPQRLQEQLDDFISDFFEALANLIGRLMVGKIFKEAEELARKGESE